MQELTYLTSLVSIIIGKFDYCGVTNGVYYNKTLTIELCKRSVNEMKKTLIHELGHYFWYRVINEDERTIYKLFFEQSGYFDFASGYGETKVEEDFAEMFKEYYLNQNEYLGRLGEIKKQYIGLLIKKYLTK